MAKLWQTIHLIVLIICLSDFLGRIKASMRGVCASLRALINEELTKLDIICNSIAIPVNKPHNCLMRSTLKPETGLRVASHLRTEAPTGMRFRSLGLS